MFNIASAGSQPVRRTDPGQRDAPETARSADQGSNRSSQLSPAEYTEVQPPVGVSRPAQAHPKYRSRLVEHRLRVVSNRTGRGGAAVGVEHVRET